MTKDEYERAKAIQDQHDEVNSLLLNIERENPHALPESTIRRVQRYLQQQKIWLSSALESCFKSQ